MKTALEFNRVTFGLPVETFRVEAYISLEVRLPVVTVVCAATPENLWSNSFVCFS